MFRKWKNAFDMATGQTLKSTSKTLDGVPQKEEIEQQSGEEVEMVKELQRMASEDSSETGNLPDEDFEFNTDQDEVDDSKNKDIGELDDAIHEAHSSPHRIIDRSQSWSVEGSPNKVRADSTNSMPDLPATRTDQYQNSVDEILDQNEEIPNDEKQDSDGLSKNNPFVDEEGDFVNISSDDAGSTAPNSPFSVTGSIFPRSKISLPSIFGSPNTQQYLNSKPCVFPCDEDSKGSLETPSPESE
ncbi:unnamed protein product, partial [Owenia fusiformis]